jgi:hypothetical protein
MFSYENKTGGMVVLIIHPDERDEWLNTFIGTHIESAE